jgi:hypothetical protein
VYETTINLVAFMRVNFGPCSIGFELTFHYDTPHTISLIDSSPAILVLMTWRSLSISPAGRRSFHGGSSAIIAADQWSGKKTRTTVDRKRT